MYSSLFLIHRTTKECFPPALLARSESLLWQTCLRQIVIGFDHESSHELVQAGDDVYRGEDAYQFMLEVICGLHSPMVGETEVLGQFRQLFKEGSYEQLSWRGALARFVQDWLVDAKHVREKFLIGHGSQSYGSVLRRALRGLDEVVMLGSGQFVEELLPWVMKEHQTVSVTARNEKRLQELKRVQPSLHTQVLAEYRPQARELRQALVVAAPIAGDELVKMWGEALENFDFIVDLRGESEVDPLQVKVPQMSLNHVFDQVKATESLLQQKAEQARARIHELMAEKRRRVDYRPFGWDDLCA